MLMFSNIADPVKLWDAHWVHLIYDLLYVIRRQTGIPNMDLLSTQNLGLFEIEYILNRNGSSLRNFPPMLHPSIEAPVNATNRLIVDEVDYIIQIRKHQDLKAS